MRRFFCALFFVFLALHLSAQSPQRFNYQAVARNAQGVVLANQPISIRASILQGSPGGASQYSESHLVASNQLGLFTLAIGGGVPITGDFQSIAWADGAKYLKIEMDATGGNNYELIGINQLLSVPYAVFADQVNLHGGSGISISNNIITNTGDLSDSNELQQLSINGNTLQISNGNQVTLPGAPVYSAGSGIAINGTIISNTGDGDNSSSNEIQTLSLNGTTLSLSQNGGSVALPTGTSSQWTTSGSSIYYSNGNVGVGTNAPGEKLHLNGKMKIDGSNTLEFGAGIAGKQADAGKIGYQAFSTDALDILGAGTSGTNRKIKFWNEGGADFTGNIGTMGKVIGLTSANYPIGITQELGSATPILLLDINFRHPNKNTNYLGAALRIDSRNDAGSPLFQWLYRPAGSTTESFLMTLDNGGNAVFSGKMTSNSLRITTGATSGYVLTSDASGNASWQAPSGGTSSQWSTIPAGIQYTGGKVLIGNVTAPGNYKLYVEQGIMSERVKVALKNTSYWADYVFAPDYKLMPLEEVEKFLASNQHLPNVPSADDVVKDGIDMATMDAKLLEKIEELTLYMIDLKKENEALKAKVNALEIKINNPK